jgi:hypothetical protein
MYENGTVKSFEIVLRIGEDRGRVKEIEFDHCVLYVCVEILQ